MGATGEPLADDLARAVLRSFGVGPAEPAALGNAGGFSGARLWRVATPRGDWCLRAWPPGRSADELRTIHALMMRASRSGLPFVPLVFASPDGRWHVEAAGRVWDLTAWMPGRADFAERPTPARLRAACVALAQLHRAWEHTRIPPQPCPAVARRLAAADAWRRLVATAWQPAFAAGDPVTPWAERAWRLATALVAAVTEVLRLYRDAAVPVQPCLCDVWHDHVLFSGDEVTGIIDYGSAKIDHVAVDLARLLGDFAGNDAASWTAGLDAYRSVRPLSAEEESLAKALDRTGVAVGLANWLWWLYRDGRVYDDRAAVARRLATLVRRAEVIGSGI